MLRHLLIGLWLATVMALPLRAQSQLPASLPASFGEALRNAATADAAPNAFLASTVVEMIGADPRLLEAIIAEAARLAPVDRDYVVSRATAAYPVFAERIAGAATPAAPPIQAPSARPVPISSPSIVVAADPAPSVAQAAPLPPQNFDSPPITERGKVSGLYAELGGGLTVVQDADLKDNRLAGVDGKLSSDFGFNGSAVVGYKFSDLIRADAEIAYRTTELDKVTVGGFGLSAETELDGTARVISAMANTYVDIPFGDKLIPYVGAGLGIAAINLDISNAGVDEWDTVFALQTAAGFRYPLFEQVWVRVGYKLFVTADPKIASTEGEYISHNFEIAYYYEF